MISQDEARIRVARGAAHLDQVRPGWVNRIDVGTLTLSNCYRCTLGQLYEAFSLGITALRFTWPMTFRGWSARHNVVRHGFMLAESDSVSAEQEVDGFRLLQDAWIEAIADRRLRAVATPVSDNAVAKGRNAVCESTTRDEDGALVSRAGSER